MGKINKAQSSCFFVSKFANRWELTLGTEVFELTEPLHMSTECQLVYEPSNWYHPSKLYLLSPVIKGIIRRCQQYSFGQKTYSAALASRAGALQGRCHLSKSGVFTPEEPRWPTSVWIEPDTYKSACDNFFNLKIFQGGWTFITKATLMISRPSLENRWKMWYNT